MAGLTTPQDAVEAQNRLMAAVELNKVDAMLVEKVALKAGAATVASKLEEAAEAEAVGERKQKPMKDAVVVLKDVALVDQKGVGAVMGLNRQRLFCHALRHRI